MNLSRRLRSALAPKARPRAHRGMPRFVPTVQGLEDRLALSTVGAVNGAGEVVIDSRFFNPDNDVTAVTVFANGRIEVTDTTNGDTAAATRTGVRKVIYYGNGGNDEFRINIDQDPGRDFTIEAHLGDGADVFTSRIKADLTTFEVLKYQVYGDGGNDVLTLAGCETVPVQSGDFLTDNLATNAGGLRAIVFARLAVHLDAGGGNDKIFTYYDGEMDGVLEYKAVGGDGDDLARVEMTFREGSSGFLFGGDTDRAARVEGNFGDDDLTFYVFDHGGAETDLYAEIDGGWGFGDTDWGQRTSNVKSFHLEYDDID